MITTVRALASVPASLRDPLVAEYKAMSQDFLEHRWQPAVLHGRRFSEIIYTILDGHAKGAYAAGPSKPADFVKACRELEKNTNVPRSFRILIPRLIPAIYEFRNNRDVGHVGGDVNPNHMDAVAVLSMCTWTMGELVRVFHDLSVSEAQKTVEILTEVRLPTVWSDGTKKRVLKPELKMTDQLLLLIGTTLPDVSTTQLFDWSEISNKRYFMKLVRVLHKKRYVEFDENTSTIQILPPGAKEVQDLMRSQGLNFT
jgi:hypothetical protein